MSATPGSSTRSAAGAAGSTPDSSATVRHPHLPQTLSSSAGRPADPRRAPGIIPDPDFDRLAVQVGEGVAPEDLSRVEWLISDGHGGFAMGTAAGIPQRRYHSWMVMATRPPVGRVSLVHTAVERLIIDSPGETGTDQEIHDLSSFRFPGATHPRGLDALVGFEKADSAVWTYRVRTRAGAGLLIRRELSVIAPGAISLRYSAEIDRDGTNPATPPRSVRFEVRPLLAMRDFHHLGRESGRPEDQVAVGTSDGVVVVRHGPPTQLPTGKDPADPDHGRDDQAMLTSGGTGIPDVSMTVRAGARPWRFGGPAQWWRDFEYPQDRARGQDSHEDLYSPGVFTVESAVGESFDVWAWVGPTPDFDTSPARQRRSGRVLAAAGHAVRVASGSADNDVRGGDQSWARVVAALCAAADQFVVRRRMPAGGPSAGGLSAGDGLSTSIIAGYPWFSDWGRDSMISLPGLLLSTGRFEEACSLLECFSGLMRDGLIPNCFDNATGEAEYNTVDASLWFIHAACRYVHESGDVAAAERFLSKACLDIIHAYQAGTRFGIRADPSDGLLSAGDASTQLTWMDARRDGVVFTPRAGKAVEINALWYHAMRSVADLVEPARQKTARDLRQVAERVRRSFQATFFDAYRRMCFDLAPGNPRSSHESAGPDPAYQVRPNQVFAVSLPHSPLDAEQQQAVVSTVRQSLLTPMGLRTLAASDRDYHGRYEGTLFARDRAYHNGTVWPWLIGPYAEAVMRVGSFSPASRAEAREVLSPLIRELLTPGPGRAIGQIAEVYDGDGTDQAPRRADGCPAQAWSVAEVLRVYLLAGPSHE